jgi:hypothetical protein
VNRRQSIALLSSTLLGAGLKAETACQGQICTSQVDFKQFAQEAYQTQKASEWCWAACISMIFAFYDHPVSQERIVSQAYGAIVNWPSGSGSNIARQLNRTWKDDNGDPFRSVLTAAYDAQAYVHALDNNMMIAELDNDHPIVIGAGGHAMVLAMMQYAHTPLGLNVGRCGVFDPWPGRGARDLTPPEMAPVERGGVLQFAATVRVVDAG